MKFSEVFTSKDNIQLDKKTLVILRWIAIVGQFFTISIVYFFLSFELPFFYCSVIILVGVLTNIYLQFKVRENQLSNFHSTIYLLYDLVQLAALLYFTGGITNPFTILLIVPAIVSSTFLSLRSTLNLSFVTIMILLVLTLYHLPLPHSGDLHFHVPNYYLYAIPIAIIVGLIFLVYFGLKFGAESRKRKEALDNIQNVIAKEHELLSLGGQAAAAAHSLGTPLSTISLVVNELKDELKGNKKLEKDIDLLISQSDRCNEILKKLSMNPHVEDEFISSEATFQDYLSEIIRSYQEISEKKFLLDTEKNKNSISFRRSVEINYGLRNFIGNANKFSKQKVEIKLMSNEKNTEIQICDDGHGFPNDIIDKLGEPYIKSSSQEIMSKTGLGLGTFIGKTLLEKNYGKINFKNISETKGALVNISWLNADLNKI